MVAFLTTGHINYVDWVLMNPHAPPGDAIALNVVATVTPLPCPGSLRLSVP